MQEQAFCSPQEAASLLGVSDQTVRRWIRGGRIPEAERTGRSWRIPRSEIDRLLSEREEAGPEAETHTSIEAPVDAAAVDAAAERQDVRSGMAAIRSHVEKRFTDLTARIEGMAGIRSHVEKPFEDLVARIEGKLRDIESVLRILTWVVIGIGIIILLILGLRRRK